MHSTYRCDQQEQNNNMAQLYGQDPESYKTRAGLFVLKVTIPIHAKDA